MLRNLFNPLFSPHDDAPPSNSGTMPTQTENESSEGTEEGTENDPEPEPEKPDTDKPEASQSPVVAPKLTAFERGRLRMMGMGDLIARVEKAEGESFVASAEVNRLTAENSQLQARISTLEKETPKKIEAAAKGRENEVSKGVTSTLSALGITPELAPSQIAASETPEAKLEHYATLKGSEKTAYWRANKKILLAAKSN